MEMLALMEEQNKKMVSPSDAVFIPHF